MSLTFAESQINRDTAKKTAKAFANIFYTQQDGAGFTLERHNLIRFLKTWGTNFVDRHIPIDANLCLVFLKQLNVEINETEEIIREFEKETNKAGLTPRKSLADEFNERCRKTKARNKRKEFLQKFDQEKLGSFAVKTAFVYANNEFVETEDDNAIVVLEKSTQTLQLDRNERKRQILLCHSILNLKKIEECCGFFETTLERCAKEDTLLTVEKDFVYYLWQHLEEIPADVAKQLFEGFGFLYEKPILKAACAVLKTTGAIVIDEDVKRIARVPELSNRVASIFCDLFLLSGRNQNVLLLYEKMYLE